MARAWQEAARDLGFRFISPFRFRDTSGQEHDCAGWLPDFGAPRGALILSRHDSDEAGQAGDAAGYYVSGLSPRYYETYDRALFIDTLNDWGWYGPPERAPAWFRGRVFHRESEAATWLVDEMSEITRWDSTPEFLLVELLVASADHPRETDHTVVSLRLVSPRLPESFRDDFQTLADEGVWAVAQEPGQEGIVVRFEAEGWYVEIPCATVDILRGELEPRHYLRIIDRLNSRVEFYSKQIREAENRLRRLEGFLKKGMEKAQRIADEASGAQDQPRLRAKARLRALQEALQVLEEHYDGQPTDDTDS